MRETAADEDVCVNIRNLQPRINGGTEPSSFHSGPQYVSVFPKVFQFFLMGYVRCEKLFMLGHDQRKVLIFQLIQMPVSTVQHFGIVHHFNLLYYNI